MVWRWLLTLVFFVTGHFAMPSSLASAGAGRLGWAQEQGSAQRKPEGALLTEFCDSTVQPGALPLE